MEEKTFRTNLEMKSKRLYSVDFYKSLEIPELLFDTEEDAKEFDTILCRYLLNQEAIQEFIKFLDIEITGGPCTDVLVESIENCNFIFDGDGLRPDTEGLSYRYVNQYLVERL